MTQPLKAFLVATAQNEAPYFLEWVAYHLEIGFTDIAIYQNDSDDLTHETLVALRDIGAVQYFYNRAEVGQHLLRAHTRAAKLPAYKAADWALALGVDEFLVVKTGNGTLTDLMQALPDSDCVHLNARAFGTSGYEVMTDELVTDRFKMADHPLGGTNDFGPLKCLLRPHVFNRPGDDQPNNALALPPPSRYTNGSGLAEGAYARREFTATDPGGCTFAQINHYTTRDLCSFMLKTADLPDPSSAQRTWRTQNKNFAIDDSMQSIQGRVKARMAALDEASGGRLMKLRQAAMFTHLARYYTLLQDPQRRAFRDFCLAHPNADDPTKPPRKSVRAQP